MGIKVSEKQVEKKVLCESCTEERKRTLFVSATGRKWAFACKCGVHTKEGKLLYNYE